MKSDTTMPFQFRVAVISVLASFWAMVVCSDCNYCVDIGHPSAGCIVHQVVASSGYHTKKEGKVKVTMSPSEMNKLTECMRKVVGGIKESCVNMVAFDNVLSCADGPLNNTSPSIRFLRRRVFLATLLECYPMKLVYGTEGNTQRWGIKSRRLRSLRSSSNFAFKIPKPNQS